MCNLCKTQINLHINPVWWESLLYTMWVDRIRVWTQSFLIWTVKVLLMHVCTGWSESSLVHMSALTSWWSVSLRLPLSSTVNNPKNSDTPNSWHKYPKILTMWFYCRIICLKGVESSESWLSAWRTLGSLATHGAHGKEADQSFAGITGHFVDLVMFLLKRQHGFTSNAYRSCRWNGSVDPDETEGAIWSLVYTFCADLSVQILTWAMSWGNLFMPST